MDFLAILQFWRQIDLYFFNKCEFCEKLEFQNVNFVKNWFLTNVNFVENRFFTNVNFVKNRFLTNVNFVNNWNFKMWILSKIDFLQKHFISLQVMVMQLQTKYVANWRLMQRPDNFRLDRPDVSSKSWWLSWWKGLGYKKSLAVANWLGVPDRGIFATSWTLCT